MLVCLISVIVLLGCMFSVMLCNIGVGLLFLLLGCVFGVCLFVFVWLVLWISLCCGLI